MELIEESCRHAKTAGDLPTAAGLQKEVRRGDWTTPGLPLQPGEVDEVLHGLREMRLAQPFNSYPEHWGVWS